MTEQLRRQHINALLRELEGDQQKLRSAQQSGDSEQISRWEAKVKDDENSLRAYGHELQSPHKGAERRGPGRPAGSKNRPRQNTQGETEGREAASDGDH